MLSKIFTPILAITMGLLIASGIEEYAHFSMRQNQVMSMVAPPKDLIKVPQPRAVVTTRSVVIPHHTSVPCHGFHNYTTHCSTYPHYQHRCYANRGYHRVGVIRGTLRWFHYHRPVRRFLACAFGFRQFC